ncbi:MAG: putative glycosyltransferase [Parasphingorhabdus sp.]|jgi:predicted glycosyltransferase
MNTFPNRLDNARVLIYSHDSFGLGHLRRCREIAHSLVDRFKGIRVLILSGSPIIGSFDFKARVDFVRIPSVVKLYNGDYTSLNEHIDIAQTLSIRSSIINHTARIFKPHLFLVDKEPLGLRGEVLSTLELLKEQNCQLVLGLRDIMDDPLKLKKEWDQRRVSEVLEKYYDQVWVYGHESMGNPLSGVGLPDSVESTVKFSGYILRHVPALPNASGDLPANPYFLVTAGGGGDGQELIDWVLRAYESGQSIPRSALIVLGPFMPLRERNAFEERINRLDTVEVITFVSHMEVLMSGADAVVSMGGYNTFCEILSFDKRALLVPRSHPRQEQLIRARRAKKLGLLQYLDGDGNRNTQDMVDALNRLPSQSKPGERISAQYLSGLDTINGWVKQLLDAVEPDAANAVIKH